MIDFLKAQLDRRNNAQVLQRLLDPDKSKINHRTGEMEYYWYKEGWTFHQNSNGYIHLYGNAPEVKLGSKGKQLTFSHLKQVIWDLRTNYEISLANTVVKRIEFNIDVQLDQYCYDILAMVLAYKNIAKNRYSNKSGIGRYIDFKVNNGYFKIYDRENIHRKNPGKIIRLENKFMNNAAIAGGAYQTTLLDLFDRKFLFNQAQKLESRLNQLVILEPIDLNRLPFEEKSIYRSFSDHHSFTNLLGANTERYIKNRKLKKLREIQRLWGSDIQGQLINQLHNTAKKILYS